MRVIKNKRVNYYKIGGVKIRINKIWEILKVEKDFEINIKNLEEKGYTQDYYLANLDDGYLLHKIMKYFNPKIRNWRTEQMKAQRLALLSGKDLSGAETKEQNRYTPINKVSYAKEEGFLFKFNKDTQTITGYCGVVPKCLIIPEEIEGRTVLKIGSHAFNTVSLDAVILSDNITEVEGSAFDMCCLNYVKLSSNLKRIGRYAFMYNNITKIELPKSLESIGERAFSNNKLDRLVLDNETLFLEGFTFSENPLLDISVNVINRNTDVPYAVFGETGPSYSNGHFKLIGGNWTVDDSISKDPYS